jgi:hypothetical protein
VSLLAATKAAAAPHIVPFSSDQVALRILSEKMGVCRKGQRPPIEDALENARRVEELGVKQRVIASDQCVFHLNADGWGGPTRRSRPPRRFPLTAGNEAAAGAVLPIRALGG